MYSVCRPTFLDEAVLVLVRPVSMGGGLCRARRDANHRDEERTDRESS